jgi:hypothetical protein
MCSYLFSPRVPQPYPAPLTINKISRRTELCAAANVQRIGTERFAMLAGQGWGAHSVPVALFVLWFVASAVCRGRAVVPLVCCAPVAAVYCWVISTSLSGWPGNPDDSIASLAEFAAAVVFGLWLGARVGRLRRTVESQVEDGNLPIDVPMFVEPRAFEPAFDRRFVPARGEAAGSAGRLRGLVSARRAA